MSELTTRILSGIAMIVVALMAAVLGGYYFRRSRRRGGHGACSTNGCGSSAAGASAGRSAASSTACCLRSPCCGSATGAATRACRSAAVGLPRHLGDGHRRLFRGPPLRQAQARALDQSRQDRRRPVGRSCRGSIVRRGLGHRDGPQPCPDPARAAVRGRRAGGRPVRKQDEAQGRGQGFRRLAPGPWRPPGPSRWSRSGCGPDLRGAEQQGWREESLHPRCHRLDRQIDARPDRAVAGRVRGRRADCLGERRTRWPTPRAGPTPSWPSSRTKAGFPSWRRRLQGTRLPRSSGRRRLGRSRGGRRGSGHGGDRRLRRA